MANFLMRATVIFIILMSKIESKDLGTLGHIFPIGEEDLLSFLRNQINSVSEEEIKTMSVKLQSHWVEKIRNPKPNKVLKNASSYRLKYMDPTICSDQDIMNSKGEVIVRKGKCINPLKTIEYLDSLLFFDASNPSHVKWARQQNKLVKWIITNGNPLELEEQENHPVFFDQFGMLVEKFQLEYLPAKISKDGLRLKIEEIPVEGFSCIN